MDDKVEERDEEVVDDKVEEGGEEVVDDKVEDGEEGEYEVTTRTKYGVQCTFNIIRHTIYVQCNPWCV